MRPTFRLLRLTLLLLIAFACYAKAFADAGAGSSPSAWGLTWLVPWVPVVSAGLALLQAILARQLTVETGFWHTNLGHGFLTAFGALIGAALSFVANGQFTKQAAIAAIASAIVAYGGAFKTDAKSDTKMAIPTKAALLFLMVFSFAGCPKPIPSPNPPPSPTPTQQYTAAFSSCMAQKGISVATNDAIAIWQILDNPSTNQTQKTQALEALGVTTAGGALSDLATCALYAWNQINPLVPNQNPTAGQAAMRVYTARHPSPGTGTERH
jgi:hypothetical protein